MRSVALVRPSHAPDSSVPMLRWLGSVGGVAPVSWTRRSSFTATESTPTSQPRSNRAEPQVLHRTLRPVAAPSMVSAGVAVQVLPVGAGIRRGRTLAPGNKAVSQVEVGPSITKAGSCSARCELPSDWWPCPPISATLLVLLEQWNRLGVLSRHGCGPDPARRAHACAGGAGRPRGCPREPPRQLYPRAR